MNARKCQATTKGGTSCQAYAVDDSNYVSFTILLAPPKAAPPAAKAAAPVTAR